MTDQKKEQSLEFIGEVIEQLKPNPASSTLSHTITLAVNVVT